MDEEHTLNSIETNNLGSFFFQDQLKNDIPVDPRHDKTNKMTVRPAKTQISLGIRPVWSESSLCAQWVAKGPSFLHADSEDSDQTGRMPRLIWVFAGRTVTLLVWSCRGSFIIYWWTLKTQHLLKLSLLSESEIFPYSILILKVQSKCLFVIPKSQHLDTNAVQAMKLKCCVSKVLGYNIQNTSNTHTQIDLHLKITEGLQLYITS